MPSEQTYEAMRPSRSHRRFSQIAAVARVTAAGAIIGGGLLAARGAAAKRLDPEPHDASAIASSVLGYEGVLSEARTNAGVKTWMTECTASLVDLPGVGTKIVTARHCDGKDPRIFDESTTLRPTVRRQIEPSGPDVALFDVDSPLPWRALPTRAATDLRDGETLCAFHVTRSLGRVQRDEVCGAFVGRTFRFDGGNPQLVIAHPYVHGTSGSPLFDLAGRVVGVVVATSDREGYAEPIEEAIRVGGAAPGSPDQIVARARTGGATPASAPRVGSVCLGPLCFRWQIGG